MLLTTTHVYLPTPAAIEAAGPPLPADRAYPVQEPAPAMPVHRQYVPTSALREGDLVVNHGALLRLGPIHRSPRPDEHGGVHWSIGVILNGDEMATAEAYVWVMADRRKTPDGPRLYDGPDAIRTWNIQGNDLARWCRIVSP